MIWLAFEQAFSFDRTIVLASGFLQLNADPVAGREASTASEADQCLTAIVELDCLTDGEVEARHCSIS